MNLDDFNYHLPQERIAQTAVTPRSYSRLMVVQGDSVLHKRFYNIVDHLQKGDVLVMNRTRVMKNKLVGHKVSGAQAEMIIMQPINENTVTARIQCSKVRIGNEFVFGVIHARVIDQQNDIFFVQLDQPLAAVIDHNLYPNPPYIKRTVGDEYQTVYASAPGSLAAPTSGLHYTTNLLQALQRKGVKTAFVTLHIGFGTFLPVRDPGIVHHKMEPEYYIIDEENAALINNAPRLFVTGTTALKAIESAAQANGRVEAKQEFSELFIYPGYEFKNPVSGLITNFHLPKSTLLLLVSAFYGWERIHAAYEQAVQKKYRFFSLGDAMLLLK
ncbi:MAG TPA: tRNA preQ1(34) S-adenosylmethionine ribosyltransferase-isomerase QueA [bacterium]|nr:tRNA preQ1(34) S-adenosylmethionine ribosyltransferase-isomerase QueA [bacterium]HPN43596.1 tRNA preQ1(34) S-adenosylmethionine ribosyltransferase-isomerase QueA [bacterium]